VVVVGDGPERERLEGLAREIGVEATFTGRLPRSQIPWDGTWAAALFSRPDEEGRGAEGLGLVLLEAAARGIPTLGTRVGGIPEAAAVVLDDPETDPIPSLPGPGEMQARLAARHGAARTVEVLHRALGG
jgi:hypothetical protein